MYQVKLLKGILLSKVQEIRLHRHVHAFIPRLKAVGFLLRSCKQLEQAVSYVKNQKNHHSQGTVINSLEKYNDRE